MGTASRIGDEAVIWPDANDIAIIYPDAYEEEKKWKAKGHGKFIQTHESWGD